MPFEIVRNHITKMHVDVIVNTTNPQPIIDSGLDTAVHAKAGPMLLAARKLIGTINAGEARITWGFGLPCKYVIHTVRPVWYDGSHGEAYLLRQCYESSLKLARRHRCKSVAFPLILSSNCGFPQKLALEIAVETIRKFLEEHEMQIYLVVSRRRSLGLSDKLLDQVRGFIDDTYVQERHSSADALSITIEETEYAQEEAAYEDCAPKSCKRNSLPVSWTKEKAAPAPFDEGELNRLLEKMDAGFSETLLKLIDESGEKDSSIYKRANVDRKLFSKIRKNPHYRPSKATAVAFAIALELDLEETRDFIGRAGYALSRSNKFDIIIEYYITHGHYDIYEINMTLFEFDQMLLGA